MNDLQKIKKNLRKNIKNKLIKYDFKKIFFFYFKFYFQLKTRWQARQNEIQLTANRNASAAQQQYESTEIEFRQEYEFIKQSANRERTRINELHEIYLDAALNIAKTDANKKLINAWNEKPLKVKTVDYYIIIYILINSLLICQKSTEKVD